MSTRSKKWLIAASIISIINAILLVGGGIIVALDKFNLSYYYLRIIKLFAKGITDGDIFVIKIILISDLALCSTINIVCAISYLKIALKNYPAINDYLSLCFMCAAQFVFGFALLPVIIVFVIILRNQHIYTMLDSKTKENSFDSLKSKIVILNKQRDAGLLDNENYSKQLDKLLSGHVKNIKDN